MWRFMNCNYATDFHTLTLSLPQQNSKDMTAKTIIIPVGFNAEQCQGHYGKKCGNN